MTTDTRTTETASTDESICSDTESDTHATTNADANDDASECECDIELPAVARTDGGALSNSTEWHALAHGIYIGITTAPWWAPPTPDLPSVSKELHYYRGGYVIGSCPQFMLVLFLIRLAIGVVV